MLTRRLRRLGKRHVIWTCAVAALGMGSVMLALLPYIGCNGECDEAFSVSTLGLSHDSHFSPVDVTAFTDDVLLRRYDFDAAGHDVIVFVHIQKTGGTLFGRHLAKNIFLPQSDDVFASDATGQVKAVAAPAVCPCDVTNKRSPHCRCSQGQAKRRRRRTWLVSRPSTGWLCGVHADWTELHECVPQALDRLEKHGRYRQYLYVTVLREPVSRYVSEWLHVQRGATWVASKLNCNRKAATLEEIPQCYESSTWEGVSLHDFASCPHNLAANRQTRMLANLSLVNCYNTTAPLPGNETSRDDVLLRSAKANLAAMAFFALTDYQRESQWLFERTFGISFSAPFAQTRRTLASGVSLSPEQLQHIAAINHLDVQLYEFASNLFQQRLRRWHQFSQPADSDADVTTRVSSSYYAHTRTRMR